MRESSMANAKPPECNSISTTEVAVNDITKGGFNGVKLVQQKDFPCRGKCVYSGQRDKSQTGPSRGRGGMGESFPGPRHRLTILKRVFHTWLPSDLKYA